MLAITCSVCPSIVVASTSPVAGLIGIWPEAYNIPLTTFAWEYGPIAAGAFGVEIVFIEFYLLIYWNYKFLMKLYNVKIV